MKIVTKDNFCRDIFKEEVIATNVTEEFGKILVDKFNKQHHNDNSDIYLQLVDDDYIPYDGYKEIYGE